MTTIPHWKKQLPLWATLLRIFAVPLLIIIIIGQAPHWNWWSSVVFILASLSDYLDGYWARKYDAESDLGKLLDPIADKFLVSSVLILLIPLGRIEAILVLLLLNRDILINGLRSFAATKSEIISAGSLGKWKTAVQMVALPAILIYEPVLGLPLGEIGYWGLWLSLGLSLYSGFQYTWAFLQK
jgi:CDP-diacylglycerol--glycerol-3-phosphate 3-phosphatidyltransferase